MKKFIVALAAAAMLMTGTAMAAEWNFYGSARVQTFFTETDVIGGAGGNTNITEELLGTSRIGAHVKVSDELRGRFEYGGTVNLRLLYGAWNFGAGELTVGQDYTPLYITYSGQAFDDDGLGDTGDVYSGRAAQIKLKFGEFQIAAVEPNTESVDGVGGAEVKVPTIEARYTFRFDNVNVRVAAGYNTYELADTYDIDSWVVGLGAEANLGAFYLAGNIMFGENGGHIIGMDTGGSQGKARIIGGEVQDNENFGGTIVLGYTINDMFHIEAGYGYIDEDVDGMSDDEAASYYLSLPITLAPGVVVTPEIGFYDYEEDGQNEVTYYGAKWQINF